MTRTDLVKKGGTGGGKSVKEIIVLGMSWMRETKVITRSGKDGGEYDELHRKRTRENLRQVRHFDENRCALCSN